MRRRLGCGAAEHERDNADEQGLIDDIRGLFADMLNKVAEDHDLFQR